MDMVVIYLDRVAPRDDDRPRIPSVVANRLLQKPLRIDARGFEQVLEGFLGRGLVWEDGICVVQLMEGNQGRDRV